ncbi:MAG: acyltransferase family protein [Acetobacter sp.]|nr:acyltransferase family protein [Bacteroides sp.]MCM1341552.1 acyltransferase family protein [Acetobacter sp.]MCM1433629.1 acyltransferase family protein [Clostridiales bacterium]
MFITTMIIGLLCLYKIQFADSKKNRALTGGYYDDYLSVSKTNSIKGIFILLVIYSHAIGYVTLNEGILNRLYDIFMYQFMGQGVVSMFLLYSGYAMMLCGMKKGSSYYKSIPTKRVLKVLFNFDVAIMLFLIVQTAFGNTYTFTRILTTLVGWTAIGNSNWYIFAILILYIITYIAFMIGKNNEKAVLAVAFSLTIVYMIVMYFVQATRYYDTAILYPLGMLLYVYKDKLENLFKSKKWTYYVTFAVCLVLFLLSYILKAYLSYGIIKNALFGILVLLLTMKVQVHNNILEFCGKHLFSIFILQRIPMIILKNVGLNENIPLFMILATVLTFVIAIPFDMVVGKLDNLIFSRKSKTVK